jgi:small subunit ribosomal protein S16
MWEAFAAVCREAGAPTRAEDCEQLIWSLSSTTQKEAERQFHNGASYSDSDEEFAVMFTTMGQVIFAQRGVVDGHGELMERFVRRFWDEQNWRLFPEVYDALAALRARGLKLALLSNAPSTLPGFIERLGHFNPLLPKDKTERLKLDLDKVKAWMGKGAQPSDRVMRFLDAAGVMQRPKRNNPIKAVPRKERKAKEEAAKAAAGAAIRLRPDYKRWV